ncbi:MAG: septum formation protein Maf [Mongoliibacter sp.]|uniref:Maf family nucleotide pyrophosphatase n=1 Tax=Mongoliibacter sp. TaxID=2022438 RepID=UPI0012F423AC|nr:Maf family nucleotide pyrophosphatase [Mongoliibacter sp.]TVP46151.1 MAG: septum formation protein Maf [Mongoliibacter sp.]
MIDLKGYSLVLASKSPRRAELLNELGVEFEVRAQKVEENFPASLPGLEVAAYISKKKAVAFEGQIGEKEVILTSDTVVLLGEKVLGKPRDQEEAKQMLRELSGSTHKVISAITLKSLSKEITLSDVVTVHFKKLDLEEIEYYVHKYNPLDKAGAYGIQEWIGYVGITGIEGSYFTVMGLPVHLVYRELVGWFDKED